MNFCLPAVAASSSSNSLFPFRRERAASDVSSQVSHTVEGGTTTSFTPRDVLDARLEVYRLKVLSAAAERHRQSQLIEEQTRLIAAQKKELEELKGGKWEREVLEQCVHRMSANGEMWWRTSGLEKLANAYRDASEGWRKAVVLEEGKEGLGLQPVFLEATP